MTLSLEEQKQYLHDNLEVECLRKFDNNQNDVKAFVQATMGDHISGYLIDKAWDDDSKRNTKVFLVRDKQTREIAFYFAINCGILFSELNIGNISQKEIGPFNKYVEAIQKLKDINLSSEDQEVANAQYNDSMGELWEAVGDADRVSQLFSLAEEKAQILEEKREAFSKSEEEQHIQPVQETFPAIDIKFLGRNKEYKTSIQLDFRLGVYVFWEIVVPHLLEIAEMVGCKFVYLFAADNSSEETKDVKPIPMWTADYDPYEDEENDQEDEGQLHKLVNYYIDELKFRYVSKYKILKPHYERTCFTLVQEVDDLQRNRELVWRSHMMDKDIDMKLGFTDGT